MNKAIYIFLILFVSCKNSDEHNMLMSAMTENYDVQEFIVTKTLKDWENRSEYSEPILLFADSTLTNFKRLKNKTLSDKQSISSEEFKFESIHQFLQKHNFEEDFDSIPPYKENLSFTEKTDLLDQLFYTLKFLSYQERPSCNWGWGFGFRLAPIQIPLPSDSPSDKYIFDYFIPEEPFSGKVTIYCQSKNIYTYPIPKIKTNEKPITFSIPKNEKVLIIEWADSNTYNHIKRRITWPNYNSYLP